MIQNKDSYKDKTYTFYSKLKNLRNWKLTNFIDSMIIFNIKVNKINKSYSIGGFLHIFVFTQIVPKIA